MKNQPKIRNASAVPSFLGGLTKDFVEKNNRKQAKKNYKRELNIRKAEASGEFIRHGSGVYERRDGSIWYREGDLIYQKSDAATEDLISVINSANIDHFPEVTRLAKISGQTSNARKRIATLKTLFRKN